MIITITIIMVITITIIMIITITGVPMIIPKGRRPSPPPRHNVADIGKYIYLCVKKDRRIWVQSLFHHHSNISVCR